ncbi:hypothetical protein H4582DRAFT_1211265 [Lactarius indigo]|nr:hypothetical protein H4582DRAFT_1211265 [Lactarius indigo]
MFWVPCLLASEEWSANCSVLFASVLTVSPHLYVKRITGPACPFLFFCPPALNMLRFVVILLASFATLASSRVIDHDVLQCTTKAFTSPWSETFNKLVGLTPNYTPGTFIAVDCTQIPNMRCDAIPANARCKRKYCVCCEEVITGHIPGPVGVGCKRVFS